MDIATPLVVCSLLENFEDARNAAQELCDVAGLGGRGECGCHDDAGSSSYDVD